MLSHWVVTNRHIQFPTSISSPIVESTSTKTVVMACLQTTAENWLYQILLGMEGPRDVSQDKSLSLQLAIFQKYLTVQN